MGGDSPMSRRMLSYAVRENSVDCIYIIEVDYQ